MTRTAADYMAGALAQAGVKRIFGVVGDSLNGFTDALRRQKSIDWIHVRHEESAAFAAGAEAHLTGKLAVCAGSCGPGNAPHQWTLRRTPQRCSSTRDRRTHSEH